MRISDIITERHRTTADALERYQDDASIFISYSNFPKLGLNPRTGYRTPAGIYTYPLREILTAVKNNAVPYASERRYVIVVRFIGGDVLDVASYGEQDYQNDLQRLRETVIPRLPHPLDDADAFFAAARESARENRPASWIWNTTRLLAAEITAATGQRGTVAWNRILRNGLGYAGVIDRTGTGLIHPSEPTQAVWLSREPIRLVEIIRNLRGDAPVDRNARRRAIREIPDAILQLHDPTEEEYVLSLHSFGLGMLRRFREEGLAVPRRAILRYMADHVDNIGWAMFSHDLKFTTQEWQWMIRRQNRVFRQLLGNHINVDERVYATGAEVEPLALDRMFSVGLIPSDGVIDIALDHHPEEAASAIFLNLRVLGARRARRLAPRLRTILNPNGEAPFDDLLDRHLDRIGA